MQAGLGKINMPPSSTIILPGNAAEQIHLVAAAGCVIVPGAGVAGARGSAEYQEDADEVRALKNDGVYVSCTRETQDEGEA